MVIEGLDGAGTTTQSAELVRRLAARGIAAEVTAEPSRGPVGALIRLVLGHRLAGGGGRPFDRTALALLFAADRLDHVASEIEPHLAAGRWVVSDRYALSSIAYQALDVPQPFVEAINARAPRPDLTLFLDVPADVALGRRQAERAHLELYEQLDLQRRVATAYRRSFARRRVVGPAVKLDGDQTIAEVADAIEGEVARRFHLN